jgi:hypothetical protein
VFWLQDQWFDPSGAATSDGAASWWLYPPAGRKGIRLGTPRPGWFTEGFDMRDLKEAKALLERLAS